MVINQLKEEAKKRFILKNFLKALKVFYEAHQIKKKNVCEAINIFKAFFY
jgi:hypothetical protein